MLTWFVGNRDPSIADQITTDGTPVDLTGKSVQFKMRLIGSNTLKVNQPATIVTPASGQVRYDWQAADVDTAGTYLIWWEVTAAGKVQSLGEALIEFRAHGPQTHAYMEIEELKGTLELQGTNFADRDVQDAILAASRAVDDFTGRRFYPDADALQVQYYTPLVGSYVEIGDLLTLTSVKTDNDGDGTFETTWTQTTDFVLEPFNADDEPEPEPWTLIRAAGRSSRRFRCHPRSLEVTGKFGWAAPPAAVKMATTLLASRLLKRSREAPFGIVSLGLEAGAGRIVRDDPDVVGLLSPYVRSVGVL